MGVQALGTLVDHFLELAVWFSFPPHCYDCYAIVLAYLTVSLVLVRCFAKVAQSHLFVKTRQEKETSV
jgi:hypothetical protein